MSSLVLRGLESSEFNSARQNFTFTEVGRPPKGGPSFMAPQRAGVS
jgi:hypothetical protein